MFKNAVKADFCPNILKIVRWQMLARGIGKIEDLLMLATDRRMSNALLKAARIAVPCALGWKMQQIVQ